MNSVKLLPALLDALPTLFIAGVLLFAIGSALYMFSSNIYHFVKHKNQLGRMPIQSENRKNLLAICVFFLMIGGLITISGGYGLIYQPKERQEAFVAVMSGLYFLGLAFIAYKKHCRL